MKESIMEFVRKPIEGFLEKFLQTFQEYLEKFLKKTERPRKQFMQGLLKETLEAWNPWKFFL